jgi:hypothetical protein
MWFLRRKSKSGEEAQAALEDAQMHLKEVKKRGKEVTKIANALREFREENEDRFAEQMEQIILRQGKAP